MLKIKNNFDLKNTITCGQIFRYKEIEDGYIVILKDRVISLVLDNDYINVESSKDEDLEKIVYDYFDLNRDYLKIEKEILKKDKKIKDALIFSRGTKIIKQYPLETIISYIISQNNRVPSIANSLDLISHKCGKKVTFKGEDYYLFPELDELIKLSISDFRECKVGFRDKYLYEIVKNISDKTFDLDCIINMDSETALKYLINFKGIGNKVASCILLFAYQRFDVFPIDTWVKKYMKDDYNIEGENKIKEFAFNTYNEYCGLAIQYMFNYKRNKK